jgi:hypothetical protein
MKTINIRVNWIGHDKLQQVMVREANPMCLPPAKPSFVEMKKRKSSSGGYVPLIPSTAGADTDVEVNSASDSSYSDFIHFNYGAKEQRFYGATGTNGI